MLRSCSICLSNVATGSSGLLAVASGGVLIDLINSSAGIGVGPRVAFLVGAGYYLIGALLLRPVDPRRREEPGAASDIPAEEAEIRAG